MISTRFASATIALLALAAIPTSLHTWFDNPAPPTVAARSPVVNGEAGTATKHTDQWAADRFDSNDWFQRSYYAGSVTLTVVRSYDPKRLYHHPELAVAYPDAYSPETIVWVGSPTPIPVHVLKGEQGSTGLQSLYTLEYDGEYVTNPLAVQLRSSIGLLVHRRKPMTLVFVREVGAATDMQQTRGFGTLVAALDRLAEPVRQPYAQ